MPLDKAHHYVYRIGSDNQHRLHWDGRAWRYEFLAGGVLFDEQAFPNEREVEDGIGVHGLRLEQFQIDTQRAGEAYSAEIQSKIAKLKSLGITPCPKHGLMAKNFDGSCEACQHTDYPDDFKGTEG